MFCTDGQQTSITTLYFIAGAPAGTGASYNDCALIVDTALGPKLKGLICAGAAYKGTGVKSTIPNPLAETYWPGAAGVGTAGAVGLPKQTAGVLSIYDGFSGRTHRGRLYFPFPATTDNVDPGRPSGPAAGSYQDRMGSFASTAMGVLTAGAAPNTTTLRWGIFHKSTRAATAVVNTVVRAVWGTQRKRGDYGRPNASPI
jgi:hypothetical protein